MASDIIIKEKAKSHDVNVLSVKCHYSVCLFIKWPMMVDPFGRAQFTNCGDLVEFCIHKSFD